MVHQEAQEVSTQVTKGGTRDTEGIEPQDVACSAEIVRSQGVT